MVAVMKTRTASLVLLPLLASAAVAGAQGTAYVAFGSTAQTIAGFGGSTARMPQLSTVHETSQRLEWSWERLRLQVYRISYVDEAG